jgi:peptide/nickel transport system substrate-binding protein
MRLFDWRWLAVSSMTICTLAARAEARPQYGGALRIAMRAVPTSLDPAELDSPSKADLASNAQSDSFATRSLTTLIFDTLVTNLSSNLANTWVNNSINNHENAQVQPSLAISWQASQGERRWQFRIRPGVTFHDGMPLSAEIAATSLRAANPAWNVSVDGDLVVITRDINDPELLAELALPRNAIARRSPVSAPIGTGPFRVVDWQPGKKLALAADENCWRGRPFLDGIEIEMGRSLRDQITALELGKTDLVEVAPEQTHEVLRQGVSPAGRLLASSQPMELLALFFARDAASPEEKLLREALALSIERGSIRSVLLRGAGQPTAAILPNWMSGYEFVFPSDADLPRARHAREQVHAVSTWTLGYDAKDPMARLLAERIALNAKDAGLSLQPTSAATADLRLVRIPLASPDPWIALSSVAVLTGASVKMEGGSVEELYSSESALLALQRVIPLFHLPVSYAASAPLKNWSVRSDGRWSVTDAWLGSGK